MARTRGTGAHHEQRRTEIADAVLAVVDERGPAGVSLATVAARAGISPGRVQHYFPTREDLIEAAFDRANAQSEERIAALLGGDPGTAPARDVLTAVLTELVPHDAATTAHLRVRQSFLALGLHHGPSAERLRRAYERLHQHDIADLLRRDRAEHRIAADVDPATTAVALVALVEGLAYYVLIGVTAPDAARREVLRAVDRLYA